MAKVEMQDSPSLCSPSLLPRKNLPDDVFDGDFFDVNVAHGKFVQQRFADGDDAVALDLELEVARQRPVGQAGQRPRAASSRWPTMTSRAA